MPSVPYHSQVFINAPFDPAYKPFFNAVVFTVFDCGYIPRCSLELEDGGAIRVTNIQAIIGQCGKGIHDISRTTLDSKNKLPRFNMPFELGLFLGAKWLGQGRQKEKICVILDVDRYRYQKFLSDVSGQDIRAHDNDLKKLIRAVRDWLRSSSPGIHIPDGAVIHRRYEKFLADLPLLCKKLGLKKDKLIYLEYCDLVRQWLEAFPRT